MKAMILAAGLGTRLRPITDTIPKALVPVTGVPMLEHVINRLIACGADDICINTHHLSEKIKTFLSEKTFSAHIQTIYEPKLLDTAGGIANARKFLRDSEPVIIHNVDVFSDFDLKTLIANHRRTQAVVTIAVKKMNTDRPYLIDPTTNQIVGHRNKKTGEQTRISQTSPPAVLERANCCMYSVSQKFLDFLCRRQTTGVSLTTIILAAIQRGMPVYAFDIGNALWEDIGTIERLNHLEQILINKKLHTKQ